MHNQHAPVIGTRDVAQEFLRGMDKTMSERRLLEEIGKLSCDELATVLVLWHRDRAQAAHSAN